MTRILVLGASGMLGNAVFRLLSESLDLQVFGSVRSSRSAQSLPEELRGQLIEGFDVLDVDGLLQLYARARPDVVVNCVGLVKQLAGAADPLSALPVNALLPHRLAQLGLASGSRLIHVSTDCVFSGKKGGYVEADAPDAADLYGRSKLLGEVDYPNAVTLRTSIIGHELSGAHGLVGWFLAQSGSVRGFTRAIFSGLSTYELARVMRNVILPDPSLHGVYHVSADPIAKFDLLQLVAAAYGKTIEIIPDEALVIDRSLDSTRFRDATGYNAPDWPTMVAQMRDFG